jgi:hypothetical protein
MSEYCVRIKRTIAGFDVCVTDPEVVKKNQTTKGGWRDPEICVSFPDVKKTTAFLDKHLEKVLPGDEFETAFAKALKADLKEGA